MRAAVFYPSVACSTRGCGPPSATAPRPCGGPAAPTGARHDFEEFKQQLEAAGRTVEVMDLHKLGRFCVDGVKRGDFIIGYGLEEAAEMLHRRADAIGAGKLPPAALS